MDYMMPLRYVSFSYLSKVNSGGKVVHWTQTLSQDSCSLYEPMHPTHLSPLLLSCPYLKKGLCNRKKCRLQGNLCPIFFLMLDLVFFLSTFFTWGSWSKVLWLFYYCSLSSHYIMLAGSMIDPSGVPLGD